MSITISIAGLDEIQRRFDVDIMAVVKPALRVIGEELRDKLAVYPGPAHHPIIWASQKQRGWWFAHRREARYPLGYTRNSDPESQQLGKSWTVEPTATGAVVGTRTRYAPWVQSATATPWGGPQSEQHKASGWITDEQAVQQVVNEGIIQRAVGEAIAAALGGRVG